MTRRNWLKLGQLFRAEFGEVAARRAVEQLLAESRLRAKVKQAIVAYQPPKKVVKRVRDPNSAVSWQEAAELFGVSFLGVETLLSAGLNVSQADQDRLAVIPWTWGQLSQYKANYQLVAVPNMTAKVALLQARECNPAKSLIEPRSFRDFNYCLAVSEPGSARWLLIRKEQRALAIKPVPGSRMISLREYVIASILKKSVSRRRLVQGGQVVTKEGVFVYAGTQEYRLTYANQPFPSVTQGTLDVLDPSSLN